MTLLDLLLVLRRRALLIAVATAVCFVLALLYVRMAPRVFESRVVAKPSEWSAESGPRGTIPGLSALQRLSGSSDSPAAELVAILQSRKFVEQFIQERGVLQALFPDHWDDAGGHWRDSPPSVELAARRFTRSIRSVSLDDETGFLLIRMRWGDGTLAQAWAEATVADLNAWMSRRATDEAERDLSFLKQQLEMTSSTEVRQGLATLVRERTEKLMLARGRSDYALRVIDPAMVSNLPVWPRPLLLAASGLCVGMLLGVVIALLLEVLSLLSRHPPHRPETSREA